MYVYAIIYITMYMYICFLEYLQAIIFVDWLSVTN